MKSNITLAWKQNVLLTDRQSEIVELIAWGATAKEVAGHIHRSLKTVTNILHAVFIKTGVTKVNELSAYWFTHVYNIPLSQCPVKRTMVAASLLILFSVFELTSNTELTRVRSTRVRRIETRVRRAKEDYLIIEL